MKMFKGQIAQQNKATSTAGFTLIEVMLASSVLVLLMLGLMEGLIYSAKIADNNACRLAAASFAEEKLWTVFNKHNNFEHQNKNPFKDSVIPWDFIPDDECPEILRRSGWVKPIYYFACENVTYDENQMWKLEFDVIWGDKNNLQRLSPKNEFTIIRGKTERELKE